MAQEVDNFLFLCCFYYITSLTNFYKAMFTHKSVSIIFHFILCISKQGGNTAEAFGSLFSSLMSELKLARLEWEALMYSKELEAPGIEPTTTKRDPPQPKVHPLHFSKLQPRLFYRMGPQTCLSFQARRCNSQNWLNWTRVSSDTFLPQSSLVNEFWNFNLAPKPSNSFDFFW